MKKVNLDKKVELTFGFDSVEKSADDSEELKITGLASGTNKDRVSDVIPSTAWLGGLENFLKNPIILFNHNYSRPVGKVIDYKVDDQGLHVTAQISKADPTVWQLIKDGILKAFSVGMIVKDAAYDEISDIFVLKEVELLEISVVSVPAHQDALFSVAKSFETEAEYLEFKKELGLGVASDKGRDNTPLTSQNKSGEINMDEEKLKQLAEKAAAEAIARREAEQAEAARVAAKAAEAEAAAKKAAEAASIQVLESGAEKLLKVVEERLSKADESVSKAVEGLRAELKEKADELAALQKNRMQFDDKGGKDPVSYTEKENAVILGLAMKKDLTNTKYGKGLVEKAGAHVASADWEKEVRNAMESEIRKKLVVAPLFRSINMNTPTLVLPVNPEAGYANWVGATDYGTTASAGTPATHQLKELTLTSYKLATREYINNEEEEDAILPLVPFIRDAMIRRMAKAWDRALLREAGGATANPIKGLAMWDATSSVVVTNTTSASVANLRALRKDLGDWGLDQSQVTYIVSSDVYYDLLEDTAFMTMDKVGPSATLLTGQIGMIGGSPVLVSGEFPAKAGGATTAATNVAAVAVATANFLVGQHRGLKMETDYFVETQRQVLVSSIRVAFNQISTVNGMGVSTLRWS